MPHADQGFAVAAAHGPVELQALGDFRAGTDLDGRFGPPLAEGLDMGRDRAEFTLMRHAPGGQGAGPGRPVSPQIEVAGAPVAVAGHQPVQVGGAAGAPGVAGHAQHGAGVAAGVLRRGDAPLGLHGFAALRRGAVAGECAPAPARRWARRPAPPSRCAGGPGWRAYQASTWPSPGSLTLASSTVRGRPARAGSGGSSGRAPGKEQVRMLPSVSNLACAGLRIDVIIAGVRHAWEARAT
jgi:hypothetical protein